MALLLEDGVRFLENDTEDTVHGLTIKALAILREFVKSKDVKDMRDDETRRHQLRKAGYALSQARPKNFMIRDAVVLALKAINDAWSIAKEQVPVTKTQFYGVAARTLALEIKKRKRVVAIRDEEFVKPMTKMPSKRVRILTLSWFTTVSRCLTSLAETLPPKALTVIVLESRPVLEGVEFAVSLSRRFYDHVNLEIAPDSHAYHLARKADLVLLAADRISQHGDIVGRMGSYTAALGAKHGGKMVVVPSETGKIRYEEPGEHPLSFEEHDDPREV